MGGGEVHGINMLKEKYPDIKPNDPRIIDFINEDPKKRKYGRFRGSLDFFTKEGETQAGEIEGFRTPLRISPRKFEGIAIDKKYLSEIKLNTQENQIDLEENIIRMLTRSMESNNVFVPIYDYEGNLLWPRKLSHEEIVQMNEK